MKDIEKTEKGMKPIKEESIEPLPILTILHEINVNNINLTTCF